MNSLRDELLAVLHGIFERGHRRPQAATAQTASGGSGPGEYYYDHNISRPPSEAGPALSAEQLAANDRHLYWMTAGKPNPMALNALSAMER